ncbi:hypothetical protein [Mesorhizobium erdmanii]|uniref:Uncharacterized protein n=1 Tax=Mesorhizobium erdmanii TaxID=1777866 RepID=A0A6M7UFP3_9HYPH|nr:MULTISPECIES: hypothetical protein [Mesorhizobium]OBQ57842.1 hypothetical protein A8146_22545 [Mesorhizobium loti]QKC75566.1 hypothetical protein EB233_08455 [Mesorhizobium erdmanii]
MQVIGMDIHRMFAEVVMIDGDKLIRPGRACLPWFGEIQVADVPGGKQPGTGKSELSRHTSGCSGS